MGSVFPCGLTVAMRLQAERKPEETGDWSKSFYRLLPAPHGRGADVATSSCKEAQQSHVPTFESPHGRKAKEKAADNDCVRLCVTAQHAGHPETEAANVSPERKQNANGSLKSRTTAASLAPATSQ